VGQIISSLGETEVVLPDLAADRNQLQIDFVGLSFAPGEVLRYQYRLEGADADWSPPAEQRTVNFANLASGHYRFLVRAVNSDGVASIAPAMITFIVLRPLWARWWFIALIMLTLGLISYSLYRYRLARLLEVANVRTRIATDLHDDIGANLTRIAILSEVAKQQLGNGDARDDGTLGAIARISRESVASMSDIVWAINPQRDQLLDLVRRMRQHAEELFTTRDIELRFEAPDAEHNLKVGVDVRRDLLLIFKEAVNNAARHSGCSRVEINLKLEGSQLGLLVKDNGEGFDTSIEGDGQGLVSMRRRAEKLGGTLKIEARPASGTTISLKIPLARAPSFS
jgi:two-component sensor histidine kinase